MLLVLIVVLDSSAHACLLGNPLVFARACWPCSRWSRVLGLSLFILVVTARVRVEPW